MIASKLIPSLTIATALAATACDSNKSVAEANAKADKAMNEHAEEVAEAKQEPTAQEELEEIDEANREMLGEVAKAYEGVDDETARGKKGEHTDPTAPEDGDLSADQRFVLMEHESKAEFTKRATKMLAALDTDLAQVKRSSADAEDVSGVEDKLAEARRDLDQVENGSDKVLDDGKLGVTVAINSARRKLDRIQADLADNG